MKRTGPFRACSRRLAPGAPLLLLASLLAGCSPEVDRDIEARMTQGRRVFSEVAQPTCATCHTLRDAESGGKVGPDLDQLKPDSLRVAAAVTNGVGIMPAQKGHLTEEQIRAVAYYVHRATAAAGAAE